MDWFFHRGRNEILRSKLLGEKELRRTAGRGVCFIFLCLLRDEAWRICVVCC